MKSLALLLLLSAADGGPPRRGVVVVIDQLGSADLEPLELLGEPGFGGLEARGAARFDAWYDDLATETGPGNACDRRVPLFVLGPGVAAGRDATPLIPSDAAPTLARLLAIAPPERAEGRPIVRAWRRP